MSKKLSVKFGDKELSYENDAELLKKISGILYDIISPVSEGFGALGDKVRFYRARSTIEILGDAKKKADEAGVKLEDVSPRFMINWAESASAEDTSSDDTLKSKWANLLVNAADNQDLSEIRFVSILSQMSQRHAVLLEQVYQAASSLREETDAVAVSAGVEVCIESSVIVIGSYLDKNKIDTDTELSQEEFEKFERTCSGLTEVNEKFGFGIISLAVSDVLAPTKASYSEKEQDFQMSLDLNLLGQFGLIETFNRSSVSRSGHPFYGKFFQLTHLGLAFAEAVSEPKNAK